MTNMVASLPQSTTFKHTPLIDASCTIRLLAILPRTSQDGIIELRLQNAIPLDHFEDWNDKRTAHIERRPHHSFTGYTAISYDWGDPKASRQIVSIDDKLFEVRQNLYDLLARLTERTDVPSRRFWIDAICIDQDHMVEKSSQVQQMKNVFRNADEVFVWLGEAADGSDIAADCINNQADKTDTACHAGTRIQVMPLDLNSGSIETKNIFRGGSARALKALCRRSYFSRTWVVQELFLASKIRVLCGSKEWLWDDWWSLLPLSFDQFSNQLSSQLSRDEAREYLLDKSNARKLNEWRYMYRRGHRTGLALHHLVSYFATFQCTDPRDKVFALLGIASEGSSLKVDYSQSLEDLFLACVHSSHPFSGSVRNTITSLRTALGLTEVTLQKESSFATIFDRLYTDVPVCHSLGSPNQTVQESSVKSARWSASEAVELLNIPQHTWMYYNRTSSDSRRILMSPEKSLISGTLISCHCHHCTSVNRLGRRPDTFPQPSDHVERIPVSFGLESEVQYPMILVLNGDGYVETLISPDPYDRNEPTCWLSFHDRLFAASIKPDRDGDLDAGMSTAVVLNLMAHQAFIQEIAGNLVTPSMAWSPAIVVLGAESERTPYCGSPYPPSPLSCHEDSGDSEQSSDEEWD